MDKTIESIQGINYQPWVSDAYKTGNGKFGKLLIIGESHYLDEEDNSNEFIEGDNSIQYPSNNHFTSAVVEKFISGEINKNFFQNLGLLFNEGNPHEVWENVAFANAIQVGLPISNSQPNQEAIDTVKSAFMILIENLQPEKVIVCSKRMWEEKWLPEDSGEIIGSIKEAGKYSNIWRFDHLNGSCKAIGICHPSRMYGRNGNPEEWAPLVKKFLST